MEEFRLCKNIIQLLNVGYPRVLSIYVHVAEMQAKYVLLWLTGGSGGIHFTASTQCLCFGESAGVYISTLLDILDIYCWGGQTLLWSSPKISPVPVDL